MTIKRGLLTEEEDLAIATSVQDHGNSKLAVPALITTSKESLKGAACRDPLAAVLRMEGRGESSYVKYSSGQANINAELRPLLAEAISKYVELPAEGSIRVADLGCSVGANALGFADCITRAVGDKFKSQFKPCPEVQYYFSDLPSNDFNALFSSLPPLKHVGSAAGTANKSATETSRDYYAAAVPGSFYDRLFPQASLHIVISAWSMHWISHIPESVIDKTSPAYNKGKVWINEGRAAVAEEYSKVSRQNLAAFFTHRGTEMVSGGLLFVMLLSRKDPTRKEIQFGQPLALGSPMCGMFELAWDDLVAEGLVDEETRDSFNVPVYCPSADEIEEAVEESAAFLMKKLEIWEDIDFLPREQAAKLVANPEYWGALAMNMSRTMMLTLVEAHLGPLLASKLWERLEKQVVDHCRRTKSVFCGNSPGCNVALAFLVKK